MKTYTERFQDTAIRGTMLVALSIVLLTVSFFSNAQGQRGPKMMGLEASFGLNAFTISSDITPIDQMQVAQEGGSLGLVFGNEAFRTHVTFAGIYYSAARVKRTVNRFSTGAYFTFHPLEMAMGRPVSFSPYLLSGATYNDVRFFGHYVDHDPNQPINYSTTVEPYIGSVKSVAARFGLGLEYSKRIENSFVQVFGEVTYGKIMKMGANTETLSHTSITDPVSTNFGVRFGISR